MTNSLPTSDELEELPLRAIIAYSARAVRRLSHELSSAIPDEILLDALRLIDVIWKAELFDKVEKSAIIRAAERIAASYANSPDHLKSDQKFRIVFAICHAAEAAMYAALAIENPFDAWHQIHQASTETFRAVAVIDRLDENLRPAMKAAALRDYSVLVQNYGCGHGFTIGEQVNCLDSE